MNLSTAKILVDLKPALDGFAGIPQESRLLFKQLITLDTGLDVHGLLQHAGANLFAPETSPDRPLHERVLNGAITVSSFHYPPPRSLRERIRRTSEHIWRLTLMRWLAYRGQPLRLGEFESKAFADFIWERLFSKTLSPASMTAISGATYRILAPSRGIMHRTSLGGITPFHGARLLKLDTTGYDMLIAHTPFPAHVSPGTQLVIRYHDAVPLTMPHTIENQRAHLAAHYASLKANVEAGAYFVCTSQATRDDLTRLFPETGERSTVIHNAVSDRFIATETSAVQAKSIIARRCVGETGEQFPQDEAIPNRYLLMVSTLEPRKNHALLVSAWERLISKGHSDLGLVLVGHPGWSHEPIQAIMRPWQQRGLLFHLENVPTDELSVLYQHAAVTVCPSKAEGFDYSGIEAMQSGGIVAASDIAVHREIYGDASLYFDPYSVEAAFEILDSVIGPKGEELRQQLQKTGAETARRYSSQSVAGQWRSLLCENLNSGR